MNYYHPGMGYQENYLPYYQMKFGHNVEIYTSNRFFPFKDYKQRLAIAGERKFKPSIIYDKGIKITRYRSIIENRKNAQVLFIGFLIDIYRFKPDVVQIHTIQSYLNLIIPIIKILTGAKIFIDSHADYNVNKINFKKRIYYFFLTIYFKLIDGFINGYLPISKGSVNFLKSEFKIHNKIKINYLGSDIHNNCNSKINIRKKYKLPLNDVIFITSGLVDKRKNIDQFLFMLEHLETNNPFSVLIVGTINPEYLKNIKDSLSPIFYNKIIFKEFVKPNELYQYYFGSDIAFFPGNPTVSIQESMGCGLPVIIKNHEVTSQLYEGGVIVFENIDDCTKEIIKLIEDKDFREQMSTRSKKLIKDKFTWEKIAIDSIKIYKQL